MRRFVRWLNVYISAIRIGLFLAWTVSVYPAFSETQKIVLHSVKIKPALDGYTIEVRTNQPFPFVTYTLSNPDRLIVDPVDPMETSLPVSTTFPGGLIQAWQLFSPAGTDQQGGVDYISFQLAGPVEHRIESKKGGLVLQIRSKDNPNSERKDLGPDLSVDPSVRERIPPTAGEPTDRKSVV